MNGDVIRTITIRGTSEGLDKLQTDLVKIAAAHKGVAIAAEETDKKTRSLEQSWKQQTLRLDEAARAQNNIARESKIANQMLHEQRITTEQHAERLNLINQRYVKTADATKVVAQQTGLARHELVNLGRQAQDVGVSLMSGQSPFTVLVQQGTQIADVFATSGGTLRGFFGQAAGWAKTFLTSTGGIVTAVLAVGGAAIYAAMQFRTASTTIEQALEEQNRLLKEGKTLLDAKASAEAKAFAQSKELTQFQAAANQRDLAEKLDTAKRGLVKGVTTPTAGGMPEMGIAPDFDTAVKAAAGYEKLRTAIDAVNASIATSQPGVIAFRDEIARLGTLHPELTLTVQGLLKTTEAAAQMEQGAQKGEAMSAALAGVATNAQLAALGFASIAQFNLANLGAEQAAAATERMAQHTLAIAASYPGMSIEVAKQLDALQGQLTVAQARTEAEKIVAQEYVTQNVTLAGIRTAEEAAAIAGLQREIAEANVTKQIEDQIHGLENQIRLNQARIAGTEAATAAEIAYSDAIRAGASERQAQRLQDATSRAEQSKDDGKNLSDQEMRSKKQHEEYRKRGEEIEREEAAYEAIADQIQQNTRYTQQWAGAMQEVSAWVKDSLESFSTFKVVAGTFSVGGASQFDAPKTDNSISLPWNITMRREKELLEKTYGAGNVEVVSGLSGPWGPIQHPTLKSEYLAGIGDRVRKAIYGDTQEFVGMQNISSPEATQQSFLNVLGFGFKEGLAPLNRLIGAVPDPTMQSSLIQQAIEYIKQTEQPSLAREEMINDLNSKLEQLTKSTDSLNATMQNALSPFYSQDPRTTKLGFRAGSVGNPDWMTGATNTNPLAAILGQGATVPGMANGGSFTVGGGYSANDNRMAVFPVASGEEVVVNRTPQGRGGQVVNIDNRIIVAGSVDADTLSKMKISRYQQAQRMRAGLARVS